MTRRGRTFLAVLTTLLALPSTAAAQECPVPLPIPQCEEPDPDPQPQPTPEPEPERPADPAPRPAAPPPAPVAPVEGSSTIGVDAGHTGYFADPTLTPPLERRWGRKLLGAGPPLFGQGRIYVSAGGQTLHAVDPRNGESLWTVAAGGRALAYDAGRIFMVQGALLRAHSAADGSVLWARVIGGEYSPIGSYPVATGGRVYIALPGGSSGIYALDAATGAELWYGRGSGTENTPAVDDAGVYASYACGLTVGWGLADGAARWRSTAGCSGGGGSTPVVYRGRLYVPENRTIYNALTGAVLGTYEGGAPMFAGNIGVFGTRDGAVEAVNLLTGRRLWKGRIGSSQPDGPTRARLISGNTVYGLTEDGLVGLDLRTGARVSTSPIPSGPGTYEGTHLSAAPGMLILAAGGWLTTYDNYFDPGRTGIEIGPRVVHVASGSRTFVGGMVGSALLRRGEVTLEIDEAPFGRWRRLARGGIAADGWVGFRLRLDRNSRLRVRAGRRRSNVATFYAYPKVGFRFRRAGTRIHTTATIRHPRDIRLAGRRAVLYLGRTRARRYQRIGTAALGAAGRTASRALFVHAPIANVLDTDFVVVCVPGQARLGLGRNAGLTRRCGRRSVRF